MVRWGWEWTEPYSKFLNRQFTGRPSIGFQRYHQPVAGQKDTKQTGSPMELFKNIPGVVYTLYGKICPAAYYS